MSRPRPRVLIIVQNLPVPLDRRVWLESQALARAGCQVSVVCPRGPGDRAHEVLEGIEIHRYRPAPAGSGGAGGYLVEFVWSWLATAVRVGRVWVREGLDAVQACNPPDTYALLAVLLKPFGVRFVFDQHDLNPELYLSRFGPPTSRGGRLQLALLRLLERTTYRVADHVVSTNESYRAVALERGRLRPDQVTVVRSGPDTRAMRPVSALPELRRGRRHLVVYLGVMGPQDGVDLLLRAMDVVVHDLRRDDVQLALLGFGDCYDGLRDRARQLGLEEHVTFTGRADQKMVCEYLSTAALGVCPDPSSPLNDVSTMNKVMEYMAFALPVVAFDLRENRLSAGTAGVLVQPDDVRALARAVIDLLDDEPRRLRLSGAARVRAVQVLDWEEQRTRYLGVYERVLGTALNDEALEPFPEGEDRRQAEAWSGVDSWGHRVVDLRDREQFSTYLLRRDLPPPREDRSDAEATHA